MRHLARLIALLGAAALTAGAPPVGATDRGWKLVWSDEFEQAGRPDPAKWDYERGFVRNHEPQWYQPENATVAGGVLLIEARRERVPNPGHVPGAAEWTRSRAFADYTSASLTTHGLGSWTYGRFEVRGRVDTRPGLWPAFWFLGASGGWPACGEVDLMEWYEGDLLANVCWGPDPAHQTWRTTKRKWEVFGALYPRGTHASLADWSKAFHTWTMDWDADRIVLSLDGHVLNTVDIAAAKVGDSHPFRRPMYLILNLAVRAADHPERTAFPAKLEVDWVRVWQRP